MKDLNFSVRRAREVEEQIQTNLVVLFLLDGEMTVQYYGENIAMCREDILLINPGMNYAFRDVCDAIYAMASYSGPVLAEVMGGRNLILYANSASDKFHSYQDIRDILIDLTAEYTYCRHQTSARQDSLLLELLDQMIENYQIQNGMVGKEEDESDARMRQMMQYILQHINEEINLSALAEEMFVSTSTLSRIFKKKTGVYFADYVMKLRVESSLGLLKFSEQNLTQISMNCGFSNSAVYSRSFRKVMGMTPSEYREQNRQMAEKELIRRKQEEQELRLELRQKGYQTDSQEDQRRISLDLNVTESKPYRPVWREAINIGPLYSMTNANIQFHTVYLQEHLHFTTIRLWNVFSIKTQVSDGKTRGRYNFDIINQALDFLVKHHLRPFLDFGRKPDTAVRTDGKTIYYEEEYIFFESREIWEDVLLAFFENIVNRYGLKEVSSWIFELSRDGFHEKGGELYQDPGYHFFQAWETMYRIIRSVIPEAEIGGTSSIIDYDLAFNVGFYKKCAESGCVPDFVSYILFPYESQDGSGRHLTGNTNFEEDRIRRMRKVMKDCGIGDCRLYITEWNQTIANRNFLNDACFRSAYIAAKIIDLWDETDMLCIMGGTDWVSSYFDSSKVANGAVGLLTKDAIRKPAFFALSYFNQLGAEFLARGKNYIITRNEKNELFILVHHFSWFRKDMIPGDEEVDLEELQRIRYADEKRLKMEWNLAGMEPSGEYAIKNRCINAKSGSLLDKWRRLGFEDDLRREEVKYLQAVSVPEIQMQRANADRDGLLKVTVELEPQEVVLMHIYHRRRQTGSAARH